MSVVDGVHIEWEKCEFIRKRFAKGSWLQWPVVERPPKENEGDESDDEDKYPVCTKSLEMNIDAIRILLDYVNGNFVHLDPLKKEAHSLIHIYIHVISKET